MSHLDPDVAALIALGEDTADEAERAHLEECATCAAEVAAYQRTIIAGRSVGREPLLTPPPRVWESIRSELGLPETSVAEQPATRTPSDPAETPTVADRERPEPAPAAEPARQHRVPRRARARRRTLVFALVATVAIVAVVAGVWGVQQLIRPQVSVVAAATLDGFPAHPGAEGEAVLEETDGHTRIVVNLDADVAREGYREVWLLASDGSGLVSLGVLDGAEGTFAVPDDVDLDLFSLVDISQEETDGDPGHSGDSIVRGELRPA